jgi:hypothetical protein
VAYDDEILETLKNLDRTLSKYGGGDNTRSERKPSVIDRNLAAIVGSFKLLHGNTDDLAYSIHGAARALSKFAEIAAISEVFSLIIESGRRLTSAYQKMIDVGQNFGGSMFEMAQQAGASGLSLEQFTSAIEKHSTVSAILMSRQQGTSNEFVALQKSLRENLKAHSYYGMTLSQLTDTSLDYMDILAKTGALDQMSTGRQSMAVEGLIASATGFAAAAGKSRDEILKTSAEIMRDPSFINWKATIPEAAQTAVDQLVLGLTSVGGKEFGQGFSKIMSDVMGAQNIKNPLVSALVNAGMVGNLGPYASLQRAAQAGGKAPTGEQTVGAMRDELTAFDAEGGTERLRVMETYDEAGAHLLEEHYNQLRSLVGTEAATKKTLDRFNEALKRSKDPVTRAGLEFEANFHTITGAIQDSFYGGIIKHLLGTTFKDVDDATGRVDALMDQLTVTMKPLGDLFGQLVGEVIDLVPPFMTMAGILLDIVPTFISFAKVLFDGFNALRDFIAGITGVNKSWATLGAIGVAWLAWKKWLSGIMRMKSNVVNLYAETVVPHGAASAEAIVEPHRTTSVEPGGVVRGQGELALEGGSAAANAAANAKTGIKGWFSRNFGHGSKFGEFGKSVAGMVGGLIAGQMVDSAIDYLPISGESKGNIESIVNIAFASVGAMYGQSIITAVLGKMSTSLAAGGVMSTAAPLLAIAGVAIAAYVVEHLLEAAIDHVTGMDKLPPGESDRIMKKSNDLADERFKSLFGLGNRTKEDDASAAQLGFVRQDGGYVGKGQTGKEEILTLDEMRTFAKTGTDPLVAIQKHLEDFKKNQETGNALAHKGNQIAQDAADADKRTSIHSL